MAIQIKIHDLSTGPVLWTYSANFILQAKSIIKCSFQAQTGSSLANQEKIKKLNFVNWEHLYTT